MAGILCFLSGFPQGSLAHPWRGLQGLMTVKTFYMAGNILFLTLIGSGMFLGLVDLMTSHFCPLDPPPSADPLSILVLYHFPCLRETSRVNVAVHFRVRQKPSKAGL